MLYLHTLNVRKHPIFRDQAGNLNLFFSHQAAQELGFFSFEADNRSDSLFSSIFEDSIRWKAWSRVESTKKDVSPSF